jgi:outer membrane lipoprotein-sorting protein
MERRTGLRFLFYGIIAIVLIFVAISVREAITSLSISKEAIDIVDKTGQALSGKTLVVVLKHETGKYRWFRLKGPSANEERLIMDNKGRVRRESRLFVEGKLIPLRPGGKMFREEKSGVLISFKALQPFINLYDGKYLWTYDPYANRFRKKEKTPDFSLTLHRLYLSDFALTREILNQALPYISKIRVKRRKFEGKDAYLIAIYGKDGHRARYWVDARTYLPFQREYQAKNQEGARILERFKVLKLEINPKLPENTFVFKPPKGAIFEKGLIN